ncbi:MAG: YdcF family protein [Propionibacteriaceae bacterium]|nr:YdcF family protein [Propionibacteriaceae bacterium]
MWILGCFFTVCFVISVVREPRRFRCGVFLLAAILCLAWAGLEVLFLMDPAHYIGGYLAVGFVLVVALVIVVLGVVLVLNAFTMVRREGRSLANLLGLFLGLVMLGYMGVSVGAIVTENPQIFALILFGGVPLAYLGFAFSAYLLYSFLYLHVLVRWSKPAGVVMVLGSGLIDGKVTPLLASRLDKGLAVASRALARGKDAPSAEPMFVVSGGQGSDEARSEASAMAEYLVDKGVPSASILMEDLSRTTAENVVNTKAMLAREGIDARVVAVTNNFHAFRAALLLRRENIPGYALGSRTAGYYWPAATIREFVAILRDSLTFTVVCLVLSAAPLIVGIVMVTLA